MVIQDLHFKRTITVLGVNSLKYFLQKHVQYPCQYLFTIEFLTYDICILLDHYAKIRSMLSITVLGKKSKLFSRKKTHVIENFQSQSKCGIFREQAEAIQRMRALYPDTIIVKAAQAVGWQDQFATWWCTDGKFYHFYAKLLLSSPNLILAL